MKSRWMKAVLENSKEQKPALPFQRKVRLAKRLTPAAKVALSA